MVRVILTPGRERSLCQLHACTYQSSSSRGTYGSPRYNKRPSSDLLPRGEAQFPRNSRPLSSRKAARSCSARLRIYFVYSFRSPFPYFLREAALNSRLSALNTWLRYDSNRVRRVYQRSYSGSARSLAPYSSSLRSRKALRSAEVLGWQLFICTFPNYSNAVCTN